MAPRWVGGDARRQDDTDQNRVAAGGLRKVSDGTRTPTAWTASRNSTADWRFRGPLRVPRSPPITDRNCGQFAVNSRKVSAAAEKSRDFQVVCEADDGLRTRDLRLGKPGYFGFVEALSRRMAPRWPRDRVNLSVGECVLGARQERSPTHGSGSPTYRPNGLCQLPHACGRVIAQRFEQLSCFAGVNRA